jgi:S1-C subfamily serine protease
MQASWLWATGMILLGALGTPRPGQHAARAAVPLVRPAPLVDARALSQGFSTVARAVAPSVVRLEVDGGDDLATASGIVLDTRGNVVTSSHAFDGWTPPPTAGTDRAPGAIAVVLADGRRLAAELVGLDAGSEVAVVRMVAVPGDLTAARFADSDGAAVGEWVLAVGSPLGLDQTITAGIISGRPDLDADALSQQGRYLLTDASVNPGESGGPLVDLEGEVVGLTTAISAGPGGSYGYAIPINRVRRTAVVLLREGHPVHPSIGVGVRDPRELDAEGRRMLGAAPRGALISQVLPGAPAARAGLRAGDLITSVDDRDVPAPADLVELISQREIGAAVVIGYVRHGDDRVARLSIADLPAPARSRKVARP